MNGVTAVTYDGRDHETAVTDPRGLTTTYRYDGLDALVRETSPDTGTTTYTHDAAGNRTSRADARGIIVHSTYDALNRLTAIDYLDDGLDVALTYDSCPNGIGRLCAMRDGSGTTAYAYDPRGNLTHQTVTVGAVTHALGYAYDGADRNGGTGDVAAQLLQLLALIGGAAHLGMEAEALRVDAPTGSVAALSGGFASSALFRPVPPKSITSL